MMRDEDLITVERLGRSSWFINGQEIAWDHFPMEGITGYDQRNNQVMIKPEWTSRPNKELVGVTIVGMSYAYLETTQNKFWLSKRQFLVYFLGIPGQPRVLRFRDDAITKRLEQTIFEPLYPLCE